MDTANDTAIVSGSSNVSVNASTNQNICYGGYPSRCLQLEILQVLTVGLLYLIL